MLEIEPEKANLIWEIAGWPKDHPESAYKKVMGSGSLKLNCNIYKESTPSSTYYFANTTILFGDGEQVQVGSVTAKQISGLVEKIQKHLMGDKTMVNTTEEAVELCFSDD